MTLKNFSVHLTYFQFRRHILVRKTVFVEHGGFINLRGFIIIQGMAKFDAMLQRKQSKKGVLKKAVPAQFAN